MTPRFKVNLCELWTSYRHVGAMGLPREIVDNILSFLPEDLKACSLTCRALFSAARELIHRKVRLATWKVYRSPGLVDRIAAKVLRGQGVHEEHMRYLSIAGKRGLLGYARELIIGIGPSFTPEALEVYLPHFLSFSRVRTLRIHRFDLKRFLPIFERYFAQFMPTLRSLHLPDVVGGIHEVQEFMCKFPHLDDLSLTLRSCNWADVPPRLSTEHPPPLRGKLVLRGWGTIPTRFLLEIPGGLRFRSIDAGGMDRVELDEILIACSSTLETFSFRPQSRKFTQHEHPPDESHYKLLNHSLRYIVLDTADLSQNLALTRFEIRVDPDDLTLVAPILHETLLTISSPTFSEFTLKLEGLPTDHRFLYELSINAVWGDDWWVIDRDLNDMVRKTGREIKFVVQVGINGGVWGFELEEFVGDMFPLMNARGLVRVPLLSAVREGERFIL